MKAELTLDEFENATPAAWRAAAEATLKGAPFEKRLVTRTAEGLALQPIYFPEDAGEIAESWPGLPPGLRGPHPLATRQPLIVQPIPAETPAAYNRSLLDDLMAGQNCTPLFLDPPAGFPQPRLASCDDLRAALAGVDTTAAPLMAWTGETDGGFLSWLDRIAFERGPGRAGWTGVAASDPLAFQARHGELARPWRAVCDSLEATLRFGRKAFPNLRLIGIDAGLWADAGANAVQELAFGLSAAVTYLREFTGRGLPAEAVAERMVFTFSLQSEVFMEIAKLRAARRLWSAVLAACGAEEIPFFLHARTTRRNKSTLDRHTNLLRVTTEVFAGLCGGAQSFEVFPFDGLTGRPSDPARRLARNLPIILTEECGLADVADPAGGSWYVESLTNRLAEAAWAEFQRIEGDGGWMTWLGQGRAQDEVRRQAAARRQAMAEGRTVLVGVNLSPQAADQAETPGSDDDALPVFRLAADFETLRATAARAGHRPTAWIVPFGAPGDHRARVEFTMSFFASGGFVVRSGPQADSVGEAVTAAIEADTTVVVLCSSDALYPTIVPEFASTLKAILPESRLVVAGAPGAHEADYRAAGVDEFFHLRTDRIRFLTRLMESSREEVAA